MVRVYRDQEFVTIATPYSTAWDEVVHAMDGEWVEWGVDHEEATVYAFRTYVAFWPEISAHLMRIFGENGDPQPRADVLVRWTARAFDRRSVFFEIGRPLLHQRKNRVSVGKGVALVEGEFRPYGESIIDVKHWREVQVLAPTSDTVTLRVVDVPVRVLECWTDYCSGELLECSDHAPTARDREAAERRILELAHLLPDDHPVVRAIRG